MPIALAARAQELPKSRVFPDSESSAQLGPAPSLVAQPEVTAPSHEPEAPATGHSGKTSLPIAFLMADADPAAFTIEENALITGAQQQFASTMATAPTQEPMNPEYLKAWVRARQMCDDWLRLRLGHDGFNRFSSIAAQEMERLKNR